ncbi:DNA pilot protein [Flyfo microvirus Tbat2_88]|nr:DNA pilot protein [Flyfo microvirus Tbat2_88]
MFGGILSAGASLLGGLFGGKKKQTTTTEIDYVKMAKNATKAGFNPLTAIRNGGSAGFTTTTSPTASQLPDALANLGGVLGQSLGDKLDPIQAKKRELDTALVDAQLRELKQGPQLPGRFYAPREYTGTKVSNQLVPRAGLSSTQKVAGLPSNFIGPRLPPGAGQDGEILPAMVAWRRSDNSLMYTYNPQFPDGDAQLAGAASDGLNRTADEVKERFYYNGTIRENRSTGKYQRRPPMWRAPSGGGRVGRYYRP